MSGSQRISKKKALQQAINGLAEQHQGQSAKDGISKGQIFALVLTALALALVAIHDASLSGQIIFASLTFFFCGVVLLRLWALYFTLSPQRMTGDIYPPLQETDLPVYTVLVPLYEEANMLEQITQNLTDLNYPADKLDIKIILEEDDNSTRSQIEKIHLPSHFDIVIVPACDPRTKPKALNYALQSARGSLITIFDAEDQPDPDQLKKCAATFAASTEDLACIQAKLNYYNAPENWLTKQFTIEYTCLFDAFLPALERADLPIPLGGTSNHFRISALKTVGAWDAYNLTEDADLGMRLYRHGFTAKIIDSTTYEEANCQLGSWIKQRTRWLKGWMQTYFVHMRRPIVLWRELGPVKFFGFQTIIGGFVASALIHPIIALTLIYTLLTPSPPHTTMIAADTILGQIALFNLAAGYVAAFTLSWKALKQRKYEMLIPHIVFMPVYWLLISLAAHRAIYQLISAPFLWEKTAHGLSRLSARPRT